MLKLSKIISGGQTGADRGALIAARMLGLETGGTAPKGYKTEKGNDPTLAHYGLVEATSSNYRFRTVRNVMDSDATVVFGDITSPGSKLTIRTCDECKKPVTHFSLEYFGPLEYRRFMEFILDHNVEVLNVAGNRESRNPGICKKVNSFIVVAFTRTKDMHT